MHLSQSNKINQRATLLLLNKIGELRSQPVQEIRAGDFNEENGFFRILWFIGDNTPYSGTFQIRCQVVHSANSRVIVESIFYRTE